jgi:adenine-specific DNA-methyltransferase
MYSIGTITNWYETGDQKIFNGACPNCVIFRFEKDNFSRICNNDKIYKVEKGQIYILDNNIDELTPFSDLFFVKVGAVSGDDQIFTNDNGNLNFVCSKTCKTGELKKMFYNIENDELFKYKDRLISRKIAKFDNTN